MSNEHITDEREAFIQWLSETYPYVYDKEKAANHWRNEHVSALAWQARAAQRPAAQPVVEPFGWWFTEDPDVFCMPGSGFRRFPDKPQHTVECIALYTTPQPVAVPDRVPMTDEQMAVLRFLLGESGVDGCHFGDMHPDKRGRFWWREHLRSAFGITTPKADK